MRVVLVVVLVILLALLPSARGQEDPNDPRNPGAGSSMITVLNSPQLAPGDSGEFRLRFSNPYGFPISNASLNVSIYEYATVSGAVPVDATWGSAYPKLSAPQPYGPPCDKECALLWGRQIDALVVGENETLSFTVLTTADMPHGSAFSEAAYFLRFWLKFDYHNATAARANYTFASRGYFSDAQWASATTGIGPGCTPYNATNRCVGTLNLTRLGVDGVLPDSSFGVKEPFPTWPLYALLFLTGFFLILAFLFWVEENPGTYPRTDRAWLRLKGRLRRVVRPPGSGKI